MSTAGCILLRVLSFFIFLFCCFANPLYADPWSDIGTLFPGKTRTLVSFGAVGDGRADDTAAIRQALKQSQSQCLDGEGRSYRVRGTLRAEHDLCLLNAKLVQDVVPFDTSLWISGTCAPVNDPNVVLDCGDSSIDGDLPRGLADYLTTRTLLVRPGGNGKQLAVYLRKVTIDKGSDPRSGSREDAAGLWIDQARRIGLEDVEITGAGKGFGLMIVDSANVDINRLNVHDLVWAPYAGDEPLTLLRVRTLGWNTVPIREFRQAGRQGARVTGFHGVRVQEQVSCVMILRTHRVALTDTHIDGCLARFAEGDFPWQADGIGIGESTADIRILGDTRVTNTWEGIDVVGGGEGVRDLFITGVNIRNSFGFGVKWGYDLADAVLENSRIERAGLAGVVIYGPVNGAKVRHIAISEVGSVRLGRQAISPWRDDRSGVLIGPGAIPGTRGAYPRNILVEDIQIGGGVHCDFGLHKRGGTAVRAARLTVSRCAKMQGDGD